MSISFDQAIAELATDNYKTVNEIFDLVKQVSGSVSGATSESTYLLYSGKMPDGDTYASSVASVIKQAGVGIDVVSSEIGQLIKTGERPGGALQVALDGNFRIIAPLKPDDLSIFIQSELPALLDNPKITSIDGIQRIDLLALKNSHGLEAVKKLITANSLAHVMFTELSTFNVDDYIHLTQDQLRELAADMAKRADMEDFLNAIGNSGREYYEEGRRLINELAQESSGFGDIFKKALAPVALTVGLALAAHDASAAEEAGDHEGAQDIMERWAAETTGSEMGALVVGAIADIGAAALVAGGIISAPVAGALVIGAALIGGYFGAEGGLGLYELLKDKDEKRPLRPHRQTGRAIIRRRGRHGIAG
ncbi:hypothetical protein [Methylocucumis oryzae]|uniref:Uncharacterized protein n=1 Tax=Methylocucumis oryzae TaxID=1632867 RepID=A0A0F3IEP9_9GAMM|nr:hypothetical protein [Methylocucumis oryzae]KJV05285.1 hypothetical protein VZ94_19185 [Methylocucumis oryzae]